MSLKEITCINKVTLSYPIIFVKYSGGKGNNYKADCAENLTRRQRHDGDQTEKQPWTAVSSWLALVSTV